MRLAVRCLCWQRLFFHAQFYRPRLAMSESPPPQRRKSAGMLRRASTGLPALHHDEEMAQSLDDLDLPKLLLYGSAMYTILHARTRIEVVAARRLCVDLSFLGGARNCITYPLAVVKTRMQASELPNMSSRQAVSQLMQTGGVRGFYAGLVPVLCGALPARA